MTLGGGQEGVWLKELLNMPGFPFNGKELAHVRPRVHLSGLTT